MYSTRLKLSIKTKCWELRGSPLVSCRVHGGSAVSTPVSGVQIDR